MAAACHPPRTDTGPGPISLYPRAVMTDLDFRDTRYPSLTPAHRASAMLLSPPDRSAWDSQSSMANTNEGGGASQRSNGVTGWPGAERRPQAEFQPQPQSQSQLRPTSGGGGTSDMQSLRSLQSQSQQSQSQQPRHESVVSYSLPPGAARRVVERYSLDDNVQRIPSRGSEEARQSGMETGQDGRAGTQQQTLTVGRQNRNPSQERPVSLIPSTPRHPSLPASGIGAGPSNVNANSFSPAMMPLSASPAFNPPISPKLRTYPQQPTYITPPSAPPNPINPIYSPTPPPPQPQEEVCVECAMRDQDMADVDVTGPGVWERESDVLYEDLLRRERDDEIMGVTPVDEPKRPKARGGRLTEQNLKMWLSMNPREPASRQQTLSTYLKSQRTLLEAEALAHARAMQEAKQLDNRMRDAYSQLRRSAYDMGSSAAPADDTGGVRIKPPQSPVHATHARTHSREVTLLENGMIVEHVDVRKEEREAKERRRKEERRARKSSRSSAMDVTSIYSTHSFAPHTDSGLGLKPYSRYSQASSARPTSVLTAPPLERPDIPRAYSQASFSDVHSLGSASPRRRFFGFKHLSAGWRSQDSLAPSGMSVMSGSVVNMHVALHREAGQQQFTQSPIDMNTPTRRSQLWPPTDLEPVTTRETTPDEKPKSKKTGFAKIWRIVTGSSKRDSANGRNASQSYEKNEDDLPLAPPPPLSYLVDRSPGELIATTARHASTPSLPSTTSPKMVGLSSSPEMALDVRINSGGFEDQQLEQLQQAYDGTGASFKNVHPVTSEPDMRQRMSQSPTNPPPNPPVPYPSLPVSRPGSVVSREKSLPPLPGEPHARSGANMNGDSRPRTVFTYDPRQLPPGSGPAHDFLPPQAPFRTADVRRQSFGGMSSHPNLSLQTTPAVVKPVSGYDQRRSLGPRYDEFGLSRRSLGRLEHVQENPSVQNLTAPTAKRKSRFGLASLLGKKHSAPEKDLTVDPVAHQFPIMRRSGSDPQDDVLTSGYATSTSRHSALSAAGNAGGGTRMSVTSRKAIEELVAQDPEFVAYRYPSHDQRLDLLR